MTSTKKVLSKFGYEIDLPIKLRETHPHLEEKMALDLINGLEVVNDHIKVSEYRHKLLNRFMDGVTGKGKQRQDKINKNLSEGLKTASSWLQKYESEFVQVNLALGTLGGKLLETRAGVIKVDSKVENLKDYLLDFEKIIEEKQKNLQGYIQNVDFRENARAQLESELAKWEGGKLSALPIELRVFSILDNLKNGRFGLFLIAKATKDEQCEFLELVENKVRKRIADDLGQKPENIDYWFKRDSLENWGKDAEQSEAKEAVIYLSSWGSKRNQSTVYAVNSVLSSQDETLPKIYNINRWLSRGVDEQLGNLVPYGL